MQLLGHVPKHDQPANRQKSPRPRTARKNHSTRATQKKDAVSREQNQERIWDFVSAVLLP